jgi:hypothetical protein
MANSDKKPDWELIETDYRAGIRSLRQIAGDHGITEAAIRKRAKRDCWIRDLNAKIKVRTDYLVRRAAVRSEVRTETVGEREIIEASAQLRSATTLRQQRNLARYAETADTMMSLLGVVVADLDSFKAAVKLMASGDPEGAVALKNAIALPTLTATLDKGISAVAKLYTLERTILGIKSDEDGKASQLEEHLHKLALEWNKQPSSFKKLCS